MTKVYNKAHNKRLLTQLKQCSDVKVLFYDQSSPTLDCITFVFIFTKWERGSYTRYTLPFSNVDYIPDHLVHGVWEYPFNRHQHNFRVYKKRYAHFRRTQNNIPCGSVRFDDEFVHKLVSLTAAQLFHSAKQREVLTHTVLTQRYKGFFQLFLRQVLNLASQDKE